MNSEKYLALRTSLEAQLCYEGSDDEETVCCKRGKEVNQRKNITERQSAFKIRKKMINAWKY